MDFKKFIINSFVCLGLIVSLYVIIFCALCKIKAGKAAILYKTSPIYAKKGGNTYQKFQEFDVNGKYDIVVIGSSLAYRGYDPRLFQAEGINMFNLGTSGQSYLNTYFVAKNFITHQNCKMVLLDVADDCFTNDGMESSADLIQNMPSDKTALEMATAYTNPQVINMLMLRFINLSNPPVYIDSFYVGKGFSQNEESLKEKLTVESYNQFSAPLQKQINYLDKTLDYFKTNNVPVLLVTHPIAKEKRKEQHQLILGIINSFCKKYNVPYLDYSFNHQLDSQKDFYDAKHLNQSGVIKFNRTLLIDLKKFYHN